ncbi:MAG TPA: hypothetical protein VHJ58_22175, partial [Vicinamibacterales bacterium]|nr:hypothetical protein [Vicinamibacterales bacterium]
IPAAFMKPPACRPGYPSLDTEPIRRRAAFHARERSGLELRFAREAEGNRSQWLGSGASARSDS